MIDFSFLKFTETWFVTHNVVCLGECALEKYILRRKCAWDALEKKVYFSAFGWNVLKISIRSISSNVSFKTCASLLIFCFDDLSICVSGVLKSPTIIVQLSISPFILLVFVLGIEVLLCWVHRYLQLLYHPLGLIPWSLCSLLPYLL